MAITMKNFPKCTKQMKVNINRKIIVMLNNKRTNNNKKDNSMGAIKTNSKKIDNCFGEIKFKITQKTKFSSKI